MRKQLLSIRRWGVAALAGVTLLGAVSVIGSGVASAEPTAISAAIGSTAATTILPGATGAAAGSVLLTLTGGETSGDVIHLNVIPGTACPSSGAAAVTVNSVNASDQDSSGPPGGAWAATVVAGTCGANTGISLTTVTSTASTVTLTVSGITLNTGASSSGPVNVSGVENLASGGTLTITGTPVTIATVTPVVTAGNSPAVIVPRSATTAPISPVTITEPTAGLFPATTYVCIEIPTLSTQNGSATGETFGATSPTVSLNGGGTGAAANGATSGTNASGTYVAFQVTTATNTNGTVFTVGNLSATTTSTAAVGPVLYTVYYNSNSTCTTGTALTGAGVLNSVQTTSQPAQGTTADATVADEFETAYPYTNGGAGNTNAIIATDADPYDALSVSYLEGILNCGVLITPAGTGTIDPNTLSALAKEGVRNVYIVGGPLAINPAAITALQSTPAYYVGGNVAIPGINLVVNEPAVLGITQDDTAAAIATYEGSSNVGSLNVSGAYGATDTSTGSVAANGAFNDTTGNETNTATAGSLKTAFVVSDNDFADAIALAPIAFKKHIPVLMTPTAALGTDVSSTISSLGIQQVIVVGGPLAFPNALVTSLQGLTSPALPVLRVAGQDATDTAVQIAGLELNATTGLGLTSTTIVVTHGDGWQDGLGADAISGLAGATTPAGNASIDPVILTENPTTVGSYTTTALNAMGSVKGFNGVKTIGSIIALGGTLAIPAATLSALQSALAS